MSTLRRRWKNLKAELTLRFHFHPIIRLLIQAVWFRVLLLCFLGFVLLLAIGLPKIWRVSPPGFIPVVRVSWLDLLQSWALQRTARQATAAGRLEEADYAWRAAIANNPASPDAFRGSLGLLLVQPRPAPEASAMVLGQGHWLLRLAHTNLADLELVVAAADKLGLYDEVLNLSELAPNPRPSSVLKAQLKAWFYRGQMAAFARDWAQLPPALQADPELVLYQAAYLAAWGPPATAGDGRQTLTAATTDPARRVLARRLQLAVFGFQLDAPAYEQALAELDRWAAVGLRERTGYWRLLAATGRKPEAQRLAASYEAAPANAAELLLLAGTLRELDRNEDALKLLQSQIGRLGGSPGTWIAYAELLHHLRRWDDARVLAWQMREVEGVRDTLAAYSFAVEGWAEAELKHGPQARAAFAKAVALRFPSPALALSAVNAMTRAGFPDLARTVLDRMTAETNAVNSAEPWVALFTVSQSLKDMDGMYRAATRLFRLAPDNPIYLNNYAALLLLRRERSEEAIGYTAKVLAAHPQLDIARVNHAVALVRNHRPREAEPLLDAVQVARLSLAEAAAFYLASLECEIALDHTAAARELLARIDPQHLFPPQTEWLEQARRKLEAAPR